MLLLEAACLAIVLLWAGIALWQGNSLRTLGHFALVVVGAFIGEDSCIRLYGFYEYSPGWSVFVDRVPLMVLLIWPVVILTAADIVRRLGFARVGLVTGLVVFTDAALIEPVSVRAGLWWWTQPGLFGVPPIGILGWGFFAALAVGLLDRRAWLVPIIAPVGSHLLLLAAWWGALRWVNHALPPSVVVPVVTVAAVALAVFFRRFGGLRRVDLVSRMAAAVFFFVLLALNGRDDPWLIAWVVVLSLPWLAVTPWRA